MNQSSRAIICIETRGKSFSSVNYSRRMYAIIRKYTPDVVEGNKNTCYAELTGLRTFFKMSYKSLSSHIIKELEKETGLSFSVQVTSIASFEKACMTGKKVKRSILTYKELNPVAMSHSYTTHKKNLKLNLRKKLTVPFLGQVQ